MSSFSRPFPRLLLIAAGMCVAAVAGAQQGGTAPPPVEDDKNGTFLRPKVDNPLPETYEPLGGTRWDEGDAHTQEIRESWELKKQAEAGQHPAQVQDLEGPPPAISPTTQRIRIQETVPGAAPKTQDNTVVEEGKDSLRIREQ